jgi:hypothetical protein
MSEIIKELAETLLRDPSAEPSAHHEEVES